MEESAAGADEVEMVTCHCCGLEEECTPGYIAREREKHHGRWICGLCTTAIEEDGMKLQRKITADEAIRRHVKFYENFRSTSPRRSVDSSAAEDEEEEKDLLISKVMQLLRRTLDSPRRTGTGSGRGAFDHRLLRSKSCFATLGEKGLD
ncbi:hypothetical protein RchiOBHm_Chr6g0312041 [Rosa chinensis]|uniref:DUF1677 family protein n=1 Tax=Rosa chinensis TaxID=74649 RepID=A0A2P6Q1M4_ROSCH|nr:uncharacterized protein LOC112171833 [Rosa chinensis]PRQ28067.1 hypothetical protein RchiOBHm_Chr6g0312041 [Rosa chinensis]